MVADFSWIPAVGSSAASLVVMYYFLQYVRSRDEQVKGLVDRIDGLFQRGDIHLETMKKDFLEGLREAREHNNKIMNSLLQVTRETTQAMTQLAQRVSELTQEVQRYKTSETGRNRGGS